MKVRIDGVEVELPAPGGIDVFEGADRLYVRTADGVASAMVKKSGDRTWISYRGRQFVLEPPAPRSRQGGAAGAGGVTAPMPGAIVELFVGPGDAVTAGDRLLAMEAMKTLQSFAAPFDGTVDAVHVNVGDQVAEGALLVTVKAKEDQERT